MFITISQGTLYAHEKNFEKTITLYIGKEASALKHLYLF